MPGLDRVAIYIIRRIYVGMRLSRQQGKSSAPSLQSQQKMIKQFDPSLEGLIEELKSEESRTEVITLSPKEVRKKAKSELRWIMAYGQINPDELLPYTLGDKIRIAETLGYSSDAHMGDVILSCRLHLKLERYLSILRRIL